MPTPIYVSDFIPESPDLNAIFSANWTMADSTNINYNSNVNGTNPSNQGGCWENGSGFYNTTPSGTLFCNGPGSDDSDNSFGVGSPQLSGTSATLVCTVILYAGYTGDGIIVMGTGATFSPSQASFSTNQINGYAMAYDAYAGYQCQILKYVNGTKTVLGTWTHQLTGTGTHTHTFQLKMSPGSQTLYVDGVQIGTPTTDSSASPAGCFFINQRATGSDSSGTNLGSVAVYNTAFGPAPTSDVVDPTDSHWNFSPANWNVVAGNAQTNNTGAYAEINFTGSQNAVLNFNTALNYTGSSAPFIAVKMDGAQNESNYNIMSGSIDVSSLITDRFVITNKSLTSNVATLTGTGLGGYLSGQQVQITGVDSTFNGTVTLSADSTSTTFSYAVTASNVSSVACTGVALFNPTKVHNLYFRVSVRDASVNAWNMATTNSGVNFSNLTLDLNATVTAPTKHQYKVIFYGDSTMDGYQGNFDWRQLFGVEAGIVAFSGQNIDGSSNVGIAAYAPILLNSYNYLSSGVARSFAGVDAIVFGLGQNYSTPTGAYTNLGTIVNAILAAYPNMKIMIMECWNGQTSGFTTETAGFQAIVTTISSPNVSFLSRGSLLDMSGSRTSGGAGVGTVDSLDTIHPTNQAMISKGFPAMIQGLRKLLVQNAPRVSSF